ncbi:LOW QUALITY PROTEIN: polyubiquitin binding protein (Doa1/Ufd3) [Purpureocillium lavendulum]|uniref:Polyubiquitin binding protein (Doa1/Ufd3) n=1 Tax=Purpureocillium lavendulum TaxID=1247861 RepID=A0AB34FU29_9HYPO|nr:LOW QUALITY PROTEIN: polyubiquitin binding protein (Doa1/Ufd3) [Purpureocillium lavendulum]
MAIMAGDFKLSAQLLGHEADVRAVSFPSPNTVLSASRDCTVRIWRRGPDAPPTFEGALVSRGSEYVNSLTFLPANKSHPDGLVISGGKDTIIEVKSPRAASTDNAERLLIGHAHNVCTLDVSPSGAYLVSGGWDGQARVWNLDKWETEFTLAGHEGMSVWNVVALDDRTVVTGCADKNIRVYDLTQASAGEVQPTATIYTPDVVRALCRVPKGHPSGADIASASNDGTLRLWKLNGQQVGELLGHESFVYCLASLPSGELVSSGEDRTVRIWRGLECVQTITHPAISVWTVAANPDTGDIVTGASDGVARVFTRRPDQVADKETLAQFEESVKSSSIPQQQLGGVNKEKLPGPEFLTTKSGTKEGQVQMIKESNGSVSAHQWSASQQQWINVGTVVDAVGSTGKKVDYNGKSYDYVFDVDIEDGKPPLKLPYNLSENPYERATKFLNDNELPLTYLDSVANFITENTKGATLGQSSQSGPDPYGTESRYRPGEDQQAQQPKVIPQKEYLGITAAKYEAIFNKIFSINKNMVASGRKDAALNPGEESVLQSLRQALESSKPIPTQALGLVARIVTQWPYADRLPGLDVLRCIAKYPAAADYADPQHGTLLDMAISSSVPSDSLANENAAMMGARTLTNLFSSANGRSLVSSHADQAISFLERLAGVKGGDAIGPMNRNIRIAISTSALNLSVLVHREKLLSAEQRRRVLVLMARMLAHDADSEVLYRGTVALGTVLSASKAEAVGLDLASAATERKRQVPGPAQPPDCLDGAAADVGVGARVLRRDRVQLGEAKVRRVEAVGLVDLADARVAGLGEDDVDAREEGGAVLGELDDLDGGLVAGLDSGVGGERHLRQADGPGIGVVGRTDNLEGLDHGKGHVFRAVVRAIGAEAQVHAMAVEWPRNQPGWKATAPPVVGQYVRFVVVGTPPPGTVGQSGVDLS